MNRIVAVFVLSFVLCGNLLSASLDNHPLWKSDKLPDLYYEVLSRSFEQALELQDKDGRYRLEIPGSDDRDEPAWRVTWMQYIYVPALLYTTENPQNRYYQNEKALESAIRAGDYLASIIDREGLAVPVVNGKETNPLDAHRTMYCWTEAYSLLKPSLDSKRASRWEEALRRAGKAILDEEILPKIPRPKYTSPFLGFSPNHLGLRLTTVWRMGMVLDIPEWVKLTEPAIVKFVKHIQPGGYWEEHDGPTMNYDYLNVSVAGLLWHYRQNPDAWNAMKLNTDYHMHWTTPDGIDIHTVDQRNRSHFSKRAAYGLFAFSNFPAGKRYSRFKVLTALENNDTPLQDMGLESLARIAQNAWYHSDGPEAEIPQQMQSYHHSLDRPAVVRKTGDWVYSISAMLSPERPLSPFYLDRTIPVSLWNAKTEHIIGGGNSKGQHELATFAVLRKDGSWSTLPLDALIIETPVTDTVCVAHDGYSLKLMFELVDDSHAVIRAQAERTYNSTDQVFLNLPFVLREGKVLSYGDNEVTLSEKELTIAGPERVSCNGWSVAVPADGKLVWPFYTYSPYGQVRVPKNIHSALGVLSVPLDAVSGDWLAIPVTID